MKRKAGDTVQIKHTAGVIHDAVIVDVYENEYLVRVSRFDLVRRKENDVYDGAF